MSLQPLWHFQAGVVSPSDGAFPFFTSVKVMTTFCSHFIQSIKICYIEQIHGILKGKSRHVPLLKSLETHGWVRCYSNKASNKWIHKSHGKCQGGEHGVLRPCGKETRSSLWDLTVLKKEYWAKSIIPPESSSAVNHDETSNQAEGLVNHWMNIHRPNQC